MGTLVSREQKQFNGLGTIRLGASLISLMPGYSVKIMKPVPTLLWVKERH